jgi:hypothetical protein
MDPVVAQYSNEVVESLPEATVQKKLLLDSGYVRVRDGPGPVSLRVCLGVK